MTVSRSDLVTAGPGRLRNGEASMVELGDGSLLLAWTRFFGGTHDRDASDIQAMTSADDGASWSAPWCIVPSTPRYKAGSPSLLVLPSGRILCIAGLRYSDRRSHLVLLTSDDGGRSFQERGPICDDHRHLGCHNDRLILSSRSRLLLPLTWKEDAGLPEEAGEEDSRRFRSKGYAGCLWSDDHGQRWERSASELTVERRGAAEPCIVELRDGRLLLTARTQLGFIYSSTSRDHGSSFTPLEPTPLSSPEAPHTIKRSPRDGCLYLVRCPHFVPDVHHYGPRFPLLLSRSRDDGESWEDCIEIESSPAYEYSNCSMLFHGSRLLLTYYVRHMDRSREDFDRKDLRLAVVEMEGG